jgi:hypothetical protein
MNLNVCRSIESKVQSIYKGGGRHFEEPKAFAYETVKQKFKVIYKGGLVTAETKGLDRLQLKVYTNYLLLFLAK